MTPRRRPLTLALTSLGGLALVLALGVVPAHARVIFTTYPPARTTETTETFAFASDAGRTLRCRLDDRPAEDPCASPRSYEALAPGLHRFVVVEHGNDGDEVDRGLAYVWRIDPVATPGTRPPGPPAAPRPTLLAPFPVMRIVGSVRRDSTLVRLLSVPAPVGAVAELRCRGERCPARRQRRMAVGVTGRSRVLRFRRLEGRRLGVGTKLEVRVTAPGRVGKYTSFRIRRRRPPLRRDACLRPGGRVPVPCPAR